MKPSLEHDDEQFLLSLDRLGGSTIQALCEAIGVTATAVRQRLSRLQSMSYVDRQTVRTGRGRPHHTYKVTELGRRQLGDNYGELARLLWTELNSIDEPEIRHRVTSRIRDAMVQQYGVSVSGTALSDRFSQLGSALTAQGFSVEVDTASPLPVLRENHCPYLDLAKQNTGICELEQQVFERVLGVPLALSTCCRDGKNCCEFHPA